MLKFLVIVIFCAALFFIAGISGLLFFLWPTYLDHSVVSFTPEVVAELNALKEQPKFNEDRTIPYPGAPNEKIRVRGQLTVDLLIDEFLKNRSVVVTKAIVLRKMKDTLATYNDQDSEERDRILIYFGRILEIMKIKSSGQLFNVWRYGLPYFCQRDAAPQMAALGPFQTATQSLYRPKANISIP